MYLSHWNFTMERNGSEIFKDSFFSFLKIDIWYFIFDLMNCNFVKGKFEEDQV